METDSNKETTSTGNDFLNNMEPRRGRYLGGMIILAVGIVLLLKQLGVVVFPAWLFTWPAGLVVLGLYLGMRHGFRGRGWIMVLLIGGIFLAQDFYPGLNAWEYIWPIIIMAAGLMMMFRPKRKWNWRNNPYWEGKGRNWAERYKNLYGQHSGSCSHTGDDYVDSVSVFGGVHKVIVSKDFKGGDMVNIFGGSELNLSQADIKGTVILDVVQMFGGCKIIVPADWTIQSKMVSIFGGIEDKRYAAMLKPNASKILVIEGTSIFAGIEIISY
jgi:predicted membrane protein